VLDIARIARDGGVLALIFCIYIPLLLRYNPRFARRDLPKDIREAVPPLTKKEKREAAFFFTPILILALIIPFVSTLRFSQQNPENVSFLLLFLNAYGILLIANLAELILVDLLLLCTITPKWIVIPGTEGMAGYKDYTHQVKAHLRGAGLMAVVALMVAAIISFV
jgi:hypothetical protein